jgi:hypothetical protein
MTWTTHTYGGSAKLLRSADGRFEIWPTVGGAFVLYDNSKPAHQQTVGFGSETFLRQKAQEIAAGGAATSAESSTEP